MRHGFQAIHDRNISLAGALLAASYMAVADAMIP